MADCERCGRELGFLHRDRLCGDCRTAEMDQRAREANDAIARIRASGGRDDAAVTALRDLVAAERAELGSRHGGPLEALAHAAVQEEIQTTLATQDPTGQADSRLLAVVESLVGAEEADAALRPHLLDLAVRDILRGNLPVVSDSAVPLDEGELALLACPAELLVPSPVRGTRGGFASTRIRVSQDVSVRVGGFGADTSQKRVEMHATDRGTLTVTTDRLVFLGAASTVELARQDVMTTVWGPPTFLSGPSITFHFEGRRKPVGFRLNAQAARVLEAILDSRPDLANRVPPAPVASAPPSASPTPPEPMPSSQARGLSWLQQQSPSPPGDAERATAAEPPAPTGRVDFSDLVPRALAVIGWDGATPEEVQQRLGLDAALSTALLRYLSDDRALVGEVAGSYRWARRPPDPLCTACGHRNAYRDLQHQDPDGNLACARCGRTLEG